MFLAAMPNHCGFSSFFVAIMNYCRLQEKSSHELTQICTNEKTTLTYLLILRRFQFCVSSIRVHLWLILFLEGYTFSF